jgi:chromosome segregation ATPase
MPKKRRGTPTMQSKTALKMGESITPTSIQFLSKLSEKAGLSPSELFERIAAGRIAIHSDSAEIKFVIAKKVDEKGEQAGSETDEVTAHLHPNAQLAKQDEQHVSPEKDESLQKPSEEQARLISELQQEIAQLQEQLQNRTQQQETVQSSLDSLQQQVQQQAQAIAEKEQEIAQLQEQLQNRTQQQETVQSSLDSLQQQVQQQAQAIAEKEQEIAQLQTRLESRVALQSSQQSNYEFLQQRSQEQAHEIASLRQQIAELRSLATIGEAHLNKWRNRTFS